VVSRGLETGTTSPHHAVGFYEDDDEVVGRISAYAAEGLRRRERVLTVVTPEHRNAVDDALSDLGLDPARARHDGSYVTLEAAHTLSTFLVDGSPDLDGFAHSVGRMISAAREDGSTVRVFGEMVSLLWDRGDVVSALQLESMWNELAQVQQFFLMCAYRQAGLGQAQLRDIGRVCDLHAAVHPPESYGASGVVRPRGGHAEAGAATWSEVFVPVPAAVPAARRFVAGVLVQWHEDEIVRDATLVTSELATNALIHGASPFRASVSRDAGVVRISVEDVARGWPERRGATIDDVGGRGLDIVNALAQRAGYDALPGGKIAWAEFPAGPATAAAR